MCNPLVSVIIPNYCHAKYLDQRIQSVFDQTYQNFEVIILDDASPDEGASKVVIEKYRNVPHVVHIEYNEVNSGSTFKQWQKGFELAKGELIWIAESDDYCEKTFLEELVPMWETYPNASFVHSAVCRVDLDGKILNKKYNYSGRIIHDDGIACIKTYLCCNNACVPNASAAVFRKDTALSIERDYEEYKASGDRLFWIYLAEKGDVVKIDKPLDYFRQHDNRVSQKKEIDGTQCRENHRINQYLHKKGYIKGKLRLIEFITYWEYLNEFEFQSDDIKTELKNLWFDKWYLNGLIYKMLVACVDLKTAFVEHFDDKYYRAKHFGFRYIFDWTMCSFVRKFGIPVRYFGPNEVDFRYVKRKYGKLAIQMTFAPIYQEGDTIWVMWWQGTDVEKPRLIETCIDSIKRNKGDYKVVVIDQFNYKDYIDIPELILDKYDKGIIGIAALSDYIRFSLMEKFGGWYLDATIYVTRTIRQPKDSFYSVKYDGLKEMICMSKWSPFLWYLPKGHPLTTFVRLVFDDYWANHNRIVNYFLIDCTIRTLYECNAEFKAQIDGLTYDNPHLYSLQFAESKLAYDEKIWEEWCNSTQFFKCNRKDPIVDEKSFAGKLLGV